MLNIIFFRNGSHMKNNTNKAPAAFPNMLKIQNLRKVFRSIQKNKSITRRRIQEETGLSWGAVSQFCSILLNAHIAVEGPAKSRGIGKAPIEIRLNPDDYFLIGLDVALKYARGVLVNLSGEEILSRTIPVRRPEYIMEYLEQILDDLLKDHGEQKHFLAIGVSVCGPTNVSEGILKHSVFSKDWNNLRIRELLEASFHIPVYVYPDNACILSAEKYFGSLKYGSLKSVALVSLNYGVGMEFMESRKIYFSSGQNQCELGHITVRPGGTLCHCGKRGCLEMYSSLLGVTTQFREAVACGENTDVELQMSDNALYNSIRLHARQGDELCIRLFKQGGALLGQSCASICTILEPDTLILQGAFLDDSILWKDTFEEQFHSNLFPFCQTKVAYSALGASAPMVGAAFMAMEFLLDSFLAEALHSVTNKKQQQILKAGRGSLFGIQAFTL